MVDTDVARFVFKWHPEFAPRYVDVMRGSELIVSFMTVAEMRQGALDANWGPRSCAVLETYLADSSAEGLLLIEAKQKADPSRSLP